MNAYDFTSGQVEALLLSHPVNPTYAVRDWVATDKYAFYFESPDKSLSFVISHLPNPRKVESRIPFNSLVAWPKDGHLFVTRHFPIASFSLEEFERLLQLMCSNRFNQRQSDSGCNPWHIWDTLISTDLWRVAL